MEYLIKNEKELNKELYDKFKEGDILVLDYENMQSDLLLSTVIKEVIDRKKITIRYKEVEISQDEYFENTYTFKAEDKIWKRYGKGNRLKEGTDNILLPIGSLVELIDGDKAYVVAKGITNQIDGKEIYTDYAAGDYPQGVQKEDMIVFNHESVKKIIYVGYQDNVTDGYNLDLKRALDATTIKKLEK